METFTLVLWIMMGSRFEESRMENLTREQCFSQLLVIGGDRQLVKAPVHRA